MIFSQIFRKYFLLASALVCFFVVLGFVFSSYLMSAISSNDKGPPPPLFLARVVDRINPADRSSVIQEVTSWGSEYSTPNLQLVDSNGTVLYPANGQVISGWDVLTKPEQDYGFVYLGEVEERRGPGPLLGRPHPPKMPETLVKLKGEPTQYLLIKRMEHRPPPNKTGGPMLFPLIGFGSLLLSLLLGVGTTMAIIYSGVKKGVDEADDVLSELHKGNLKARFKVDRKDEFGRAMMRFNTMADEIEKLVINLKEVDQARTRLLQELAHDLRTPIASLKNLQETLQYRKNDLSVEVQNEMTDLSLKEIYYFERLVEELLFLAQIKEPSLQSKYPSVEIGTVLLETAEDVLTSYQHQDKKIQLKSDLKGLPLAVTGDPHLFTRLFRNALENSFSFAKSEVRIQVQEIDGKVEILVEDDGPGFSEEALATFGSRRVTRRLESQPHGRLSLGLGSVIMKSIVDALGGSLSASNLKEELTIKGGAIKIILPSKKV